MHIFQVSEFILYFNDAVRSFMNEQQMAIEGEVAEYKVSQQRFVWFKIKDADGVLDCFAMLFSLKQPIEDGMKVRVYGYPKIFHRSGKLSINIARVELVGEGALKRAFELMKKKLSDEGLFSTERKRPIPRIPERIALITSPEAAAYTDFLRILNNRWSGVEIHLAPVAVQGRDAVANIVGAFRYINKHATQYDVVVLTRGGGSMEDLAAFNDEAVARAIFSSAVPVVVGVGHERDETIADYVADVRASTPTNAAERVVPDRRDVRFAVTSRVQIMEHVLTRAMERRAARLHQSLGRLSEHVGGVVRRVRSGIESFQRSGIRFGIAVQEKNTAVSVMANHMTLGMGHHLGRRQERFVALQRLLASLDPKAVLRRGYAMVRDTGGRVVKDPDTVDVGAQITIQLAGGSLGARVISSSGQTSLPL